MTMASRTDIPTLITSALFLLLAARICWALRHRLLRSNSASTLTADVDWTDAKNYENCAPIDLTTVGAQTELPDDHPLRKMNGVRPSDISPFHNSHMTREEIAQNFSELDARVSRLEKPDG
jgi:hypothetical protein